MIEELTTWLEAIYGNKDWIVATPVLAGSAKKAKALQDLGARRALCIGATRGTGPLPDPGFAPDPIVFDLQSDDMMKAIRDAMQLLANLPDDAVVKVDVFDPERSAWVMGAIFDDGRPVAGRQKYARRPNAWQALEDKTAIDATWDASGVPRSPSQVVALDDQAALTQAVVALDLGDGVVVAADSRDGFHGGAALTRWVRNAEELRRIQTDYQPFADHVRVMPFLEGIPCSIHGFVFDDYVAVLRPCEMLVFRKPDGRFHYGRAATYWDPSPTKRKQMRDVAKLVGAHLRESVGYRGAFTMDGVMTANGFRPTELNPRYGAALGTMGLTVDVDLMLINQALVHGEEVTWSPRAFESLILDAADQNRDGTTMAVFSTRVTEEDTAKMVWEDENFRLAQDEESPDATAKLGPHAMGGLVFVTLSNERVPIGPSLAPRAIKALMFVAELWSLDIGPLEPAETR